MSHYYIEHFKVQKLWGYKDYSIRFFKDMNVIIGPNASGKTTLINILYDTLTVNLVRLLATEFSEISITLRSFDDKQAETILVSRQPEEVVFHVGKRKFNLSAATLQHFEGRALIDMPRRFIKRRYGFDWSEIQNALSELVPAVWLPVSRRLPIADEEDMARRPLHHKPLESVDECLANLVQGLKHYRLSLNSDLSELRKEFQLQVLSNILFDKKHDQSFSDPGLLEPPSEEEKKKLLKAFRDVGLVDSKMEARIDAHFAAGKEAVAKLKERTNEVPFSTIFIIPLISRTRSIVEFAQDLETKREVLFSALHGYETIVNSFFNGKSVKVSEQGSLEIVPNRREREQLDWRHLSSGEKQILILLTQALLSGGRPMVYVADEPELSLHVTWQEKLLISLKKLAGGCQFIIATHSPDVTAGFGDRVIDLARI